MNAGKTPYLRDKIGVVSQLEDGAGGGIVRESQRKSELVGSALHVGERRKVLRERSVKLIHCRGHGQSGEGDEGNEVFFHCVCNVL